MIGALLFAEVVVLCVWWFSVSTFFSSCSLQLDIVGQNYVSPDNLKKPVAVTEVEKAAFDLRGDWLATFERWDDGQMTPEYRIKFWFYNKKHQKWVALLVCTCAQGDLFACVCVCFSQGFLQLYLYKGAFQLSTDCKTRHLTWCVCWDSCLNYLYKGGFRLSTDSFDWVCLLWQLPKLYMGAFRPSADCKTRHLTGCVCCDSYICCTVT